MSSIRSASVFNVCTDKLRIFFVELKKFRPNRIDRQNMLDVWMTFLQNPLNDEIQTVPEVKEALDTLKELSSNREEQEIYYLRRHAELGYLSEKNLAVQKAKTEGEKIGLEKGRAEERAKAEKELVEQKAKAEAKQHAERIGMAKKMLSDGLSVDVVSKYSGLSIAEVEVVKNS